jgi:alpha-beta hydrolase superfamily lysophospholipase
MNFSERRVTTDDGTEIFVRAWEPTQQAQGIVHVVHGMAEHGGRYAAVAQSLAASGYAVVASDLRGHGNTAPTPAMLGSFGSGNGWRRVLADLHTVSTDTQQRFPGAAVCLLGHSMGSFLAQTYALEYPNEIDALVLSGSNAGGGVLVSLGRLFARVERLRQGPEGRSAILELLSFRSYNRGFQPVRTEADWLSSDEEQVDLYIRDPLCGFRSQNQLWVDLLDALGRLGTAKWNTLPPSLPVYLFSGEHDPVGLRTTGVTRLAKQMQKAGLRRVTTKFYPNSRHECFNERCREQVIADLLLWLQNNLRPRA